MIRINEQHLGSEASKEFALEFIKEMNSRGYEMGYGDDCNHPEMDEIPDNIWEDAINETLKRFIETAANQYYQMAVVRNYMDDELCEAIHGTVNTEQEFYDEYCKRHLQKFGEKFMFEKRNPQI